MDEADDAFIITTEQGCEEFSEVFSSSFLFALDTIFRGPERLHLALNSD